MMNAYAAADTMSRDVLPGSEPVELIEEIVLNPQPDLDAVPVEGLQREDHAMGVDEEEIRRGRVGRNATVFGNSNTIKAVIRSPQCDEVRV